MVMSLPGKPKGIDGGEVERYFHEGKIKEIADYCETDIVNTYRVWLRTARHRKRYLMPAARINLSFELSSAVTYMSISAGVHRHRIDSELLQPLLHRRRGQHLGGS
jgi:predicted PolB exonuclease-like 3'-5' exonuclease